MSDTTSELRQKLIEKYIEIAASFYYEGSDEIVERNKYAPEFADEILALLAAQRQQWEVAAKKDELEFIGQYFTESSGVPPFITRRIAALDGELGKEQ